MRWVCTYRFGRTGVYLWPGEGPGHASGTNAMPQGTADYMRWANFVSGPDFWWNVTVMRATCPQVAALRFIRPDTGLSTVAKLDGLVTSATIINLFQVDMQHIRAFRLVVGCNAHMYKTLSGWWIF